MRIIWTNKDKMKTANALFSGSIGNVTFAFALGALSQNCNGIACWFGGLNFIFFMPVPAQSMIDPSRPPAAGFLVVNLHDGRDRFGEASHGCKRSCGQEAPGNRASAQPPNPSCA